jgi:uncharacterized membrane protein
MQEAPFVGSTAGGALTRSGALRLNAIDLLRGLVIVIMVLDHVRDYFHLNALAFDPTNLEQTNPALFLTRWITHFCAPTFVFLAGVSSYLQKANGKSPGDLSRFLLTRGLWLVALELTLIGFGFSFAAFTFLQVIWAIGVGMILLAALSWLPATAVLAMGMIILLGHSLVAPIDAADFGPAGVLWALAFEPGPAPGGIVIYPFVPWLGALLVGYGLGPVFARPAPARRAALLVLGLGSLALFVVLRGLNGYGDPAPWSVRPDPVFTVLSFVNVSKYPPSPDYLLLTLGVAFLLLVALDRLRGPVASVLLTFGRTPLFSYVLHIYLVHGLALALGLAMGFPASVFLNMIGESQEVVAAGWGLSLPLTYAVWVLVLVLLYPASRWFEGVKRRRRDWWLGYL